MVRLEKLFICVVPCVGVGIRQNLEKEWVQDGVCLCFYMSVCVVWKNWVCMIMGIKEENTSKDCVCAGGKK